MLQHRSVKQRQNSILIISQFKTLIYYNQRVHSMWHTDPRLMDQQHLLQYSYLDSIKLSTWIVWLSETLSQKNDCELNLRQAEHIVMENSQPLLTSDGKDAIPIQ